MSDTPRTDEVTMDGCYKVGGERIWLQSWDYQKANHGEVVSADFARQLERELNEARQALSGRTVSCSACNAMADQIQELRNELERFKNKCNALRFIVRWVIPIWTTQDNNGSQPSHGFVECLKNGDSTETCTAITFAEMEMVHRWLANADAI